MSSGKLGPPACVSSHVTRRKSESIFQRPVFMGPGFRRGDNRGCIFRTSPDRRTCHGKQNKVTHRSADATRFSESEQRAHVKEVNEALGGRSSERLRRLAG